MQGPLLLIWRDRCYTVQIRETTLTLSRDLLHSTITVESKLHKEQYSFFFSVMESSIVYFIVCLWRTQTQKL